MKWGKLNTWKADNWLSVFLIGALLTGIDSGFTSPINRAAFGRTAKPAVPCGPATGSRPLALAPSSKPADPDSAFPELKRTPAPRRANRPSAPFFLINDKIGIQAQPCDNAITLAYYGGISPDDFTAYNELTPQDIVQPGVVYYLEKKEKRAKIAFHVVKAGQTLRQVAYQYGVQVRALEDYNQLEATQRLREGRVLWLQTKRPRNQPPEIRTPLPTTKPASPPARQPAPTPRYSPPTRDTLTLELTLADSIASTEPDPVPETRWETKTTPAKITPAAGNRPAPKPTSKKPRNDDRVWINQFQIETGQGDSPILSGNAPSADVRFHVVRPGENLYRIGLRYKVTPAQIQAWNNLPSQTVEIGQRLVIYRR
jgi:membrane-bound lytic murein transglycosylase D